MLEIISWEQRKVDKQDVVVDIDLRAIAVNGTTVVKKEQEVLEFGIDDQEGREHKLSNCQKSK